MHFKKVLVGMLETDLVSGYPDLAGVGEGKRLCPHSEVCAKARGILYKYSYPSSIHPYIQSVILLCCHHLVLAHLMPYYVSHS